mgnify:CR=1 FL=1
MTFSAEFRRNLWLELSPQRLLALPAILLVVVLLQQVARGSDPEGLATVGSWTFSIMVFLWGSRRAAAAVAEEVNGDTWSGQRLSALSPAALVFGKLFGATAFIWYGGLIGLALFLVGQGLEGAPPGELLVQSLLRVSAGIFLHAVAIAVTLALLNKRRVVARLGTTLPQLLALGAALLFFAFFARSTLLHSLDWWRGSVAWYDLLVDGPLFAALSAFVFAGWAVLACLRLMAVQLQRQWLPWAWPAFVLFLMLYAAGFAPPQERAALSFAAALGCFYLALFAERNEPLRFRQCFAAFADRRWRRGLSLLPAWALGWPFLLGASLLLGGDSLLRLGLLWDLAALTRAGIPTPLVAGVGVACFALRDAAFVLWMNAGRSRRADTAALVYLLVLYGPLQALLGGLGVWQLAALLTPLPLGAGPWPLLAALLQAALFGWLALRRWRALFAA